MTDSRSLLSSTIIWFQSDFEAVEVLLHDNNAILIQTTSDTELLVGTEHIRLGQKNEQNQEI